MRTSSVTLIAAVAIGLLAGSTVGVAAQEQTSTRTDLLPGIELITEAAEPGVLRIVSDGVRDLSIPLVAGVDEVDHPRTSRIAVGPRRSVWVFGPETFFRLGDAAAHEARAWDSVEVNDRTGTIWALIDGGRLETFDGASWDRKARPVLDFDIHPDGSVFVAQGEPGDTKIIGPLRQRDWLAGWNVEERPSETVAVESFVVRPGPGHEGKGSYKGWALAGGWVNTLGNFGPFNDHGEVRSMATGPDDTTWFLSRFDGAATVVDGRLTATPQYLVTKGPPEDGDWFEIPEMRPVSPTFSEGLVVAADGSLWLPSDDGLAHFDGQTTWKWYLRGHHIDDVDIATDGKVWVQASDTATVSTYVIDPEAAMAAE